MARLGLRTAVPTPSDGRRQPTFLIGVVGAVAGIFGQWVVITRIEMIRVSDVYQAQGITEDGGYQGDMPVSLALSSGWLW